MYTIYDHDIDIILILINANLLMSILRHNPFSRRTIVAIITWVCFLRISHQAIFALTASECGIALHGEHAEDRDILVLLFRPSDPLLTHRLRLQVQLTRQPLTQRVGGHIFSQNVYTNKHACVHTGCHEIYAKDEPAVTKLSRASLQGDVSATLAIGSDLRL